MGRPRRLYLPRVRYGAIGFFRLNRWAIAVADRPPRITSVTYVAYAVPCMMAPSPLAALLLQFAYLHGLPCLTEGEPRAQRSFTDRSVRTRNK